LTRDTPLTTLLIFVWKRVN